ncbi:MAG TPA: DUF120 domain-containing protein [Candidatus Acidoferrales bacterium]|nr:DUF120 domain-containing protein [Candidatus Acidoferrales bacterium]
MALGKSKARAKLILTGKVSNGMGKAALFLSIPAYKTRFMKSIGYIPYPGTLNIKLSASEARKVPLMIRIKHRLIKGFVLDGKRYGAVRCYSASINGKPGAFVIRPQKSRYPDTIMEIVSRKRLKGRGLKTGSTVSVVITA